MSKFGWSYPPGCTESMLPGNSKEEQEAEAMVESLYEAISPLRQFYAEVGAAEMEEDNVVAALEIIVGKAYAEGKADALADESSAREHASVRHCDRCGADGIAFGTHALPDGWTQGGHGEEICNACDTEIKEALAAHASKVQ